MHRLSLDYVGRMLTWPCHSSELCFQKSRGKFVGLQVETGLAMEIQSETPYAVFYYDASQAHSPRHPPSDITGQHRYVTNVIMLIHSLLHPIIFFSSSLLVIFSTMENRVHSHKNNARVEWISID